VPKADLAEREIKASETVTEMATKSICAGWTIATMLVKVDPEIFSLSTSSITVVDDAELRKVKKIVS
jgi:hypothetical protein